MPPHRDWTRRGAGRALLYWPLLAFLLVAAFPALAVPLVVGSGFGLLVIGTIGGVAGKRRRARKLAKARRDDLTEPARSGGAGAPVSASERDAWPTGRHARHPTRRHAPAVPGTSVAAGTVRAVGTTGEPARRDAA